MAQDFRFTLRHGQNKPSEEQLLNHELGYCDDGIVYSKDRDGNLTIVAQELKYGIALPAKGVQGQIFYLLED